MSERFVGKQEHIPEDIIEAKIQEFYNDDENIMVAKNFIRAYELGTVEQSPWMKEQYLATKQALEKFGSENISLAEERIKQKKLKHTGEGVAKSDEAAENKTIIEAPVGQFEGARFPEGLYEGIRESSVTDITIEALKSNEVMGQIKPAVSGRGFFTQAIHSITPTGKRQYNPEISLPDETDEAPTLLTYSRKKGDIRFVIPDLSPSRPRGLVQRGKSIPTLFGYDLVAAGRKESLAIVSPDREFPLYRPLDPLLEPMFAIRPSVEEKKLDPAPFIPTEEEREYWKRVLPLPKELAAYAQEHREAIPGIVQWLLQKTYLYAVNNNYSDFLTQHTAELPLIIDELRLGHCDLLSWASMAYFRQLGVACFATEDLVTAETGEAFKAKVGHARVGVIMSDQSVRIFDPTSYCASYEVLQSHGVMDPLFLKLGKSYKQAKTEDEKRDVLRKYKKEIMATLYAHNSRAVAPSPSHVNNFPLEERGALHSSDIDFLKNLGVGERLSIYVPRLSVDNFNRRIGETQDPVSHLDEIAKDMMYTDFSGSLFSLSTNNGRKDLGVIENREDRMLFAEMIEFFAQNGVNLPSGEFTLSDMAGIISVLLHKNKDVADINSTRGFLGMVNLNLRACEKFLGKESMRQLLVECLSSPQSLHHTIRGTDFYPQWEWDTDFSSYEDEKIVLKYMGFQPEYFVSVLPLNVQKANCFSDSYKKALSAYIREGNAAPLAHMLKKENGAKYEFLLTLGQAFLALTVVAFENVSEREEWKRKFELDESHLMKLAKQFRDPKSGYKPVHEKVASLSSVLPVSGGPDFNRGEFEKIFSFSPKEEKRSIASVVHFLEQKFGSGNRFDPSDIERGELEVYDPLIHDVKDIAWAATARDAMRYVRVPKSDSEEFTLEVFNPENPLHKEENIFHVGNTYARRRKSAPQKPEPIHICIDLGPRFSGYGGIGDLISEYPKVCALLKGIREYEKRTGTSIYITTGASNAYFPVSIVGAKFPVEVVAESMICLSESEGKPFTGIGIKERGKNILPKNFLYIGVSDAHAAAIGYQLGDKRKSTTFDKMGIEIFLHVKKEWVQAGKTV